MIKNQKYPWFFPSPLSLTILSPPDLISPSQQEGGENRVFLRCQKSSPLLLAGRRSSPLFLIDWRSSVFTKCRRLSKNREPDRSSSRSQLLSLSGPSSLEISLAIPTAAFSNSLVTSWLVVFVSARIKRYLRRKHRFESGFDDVYK